MNTSWIGWQQEGASRHSFLSVMDAVWVSIFAVRTFTAAHACTMLPKKVKGIQCRRIRGSDISYFWKGSCGMMWEMYPPSIVINQWIITLPNFHCHGRTQGHLPCTTEVSTYGSGDLDHCHMCRIHLMWLGCLNTETQNQSSPPFSVSWLSVSNNHRPSEKGDWSLVQSPFSANYGSRLSLSLGQCMHSAGQTLELGTMLTYDAD
jgi:hypothetical protein